MSGEILLGANNNYYNFNEFSDESRVRKSGRHRKTGHYNSRPAQKPTNKNTKYNKDGDCYVARNNNKKRMSLAGRAVVATILSVLFALIIKQAVGGISKPTADYETNGKSITAIADEENMNEDIILSANNLDKNEKVPDEIIMPKEYNPLDDALYMMDSKINNDGLTKEDKDALGELYSKLTEIKEKQDETGKVYSDGKFAYISLSNDINAEDLKTAYGIKDGVIKKYNNLSPSYSTYKETTADCGPTGYWDYSTHTFQKGEAVKIPISELNGKFQSWLASI